MKITRTRCSCCSRLMMMMMMIYTSSLILASISSVRAQDTTTACYKSLMENLPDEAFNSTSQLSENHQAHFARYSQTGKDSPGNSPAWCPRKKVGDELREYLQIDFGEVYLLKQITTKGLVENEVGLHSTQFIKIKYRREETAPWIEYRNEKSNTAIVANDDASLENNQILSPVIVARWIRIYPYTQQQASTACLSVSFSGCSANGLVEYATIDDSNRTDLSYDNRNLATRLLHGGLGKLIGRAKPDSVAKEDPFVWHKESHDQTRWLLFRFNDFYSFDQISLHSLTGYQPDKINARLFRVEWPASHSIMTSFNIKQLLQTYPVIAQAKSHTAVTSFLGSFETVQQQQQPVPQDKSLFRLGNLVAVELHFSHTLDQMGLLNASFVNRRPSVTPQRIEKMIEADKKWAEKYAAFLVNNPSGGQDTATVIQPPSGDGSPIPSQQFAKYATMVVVGLLCVLLGLFMVVLFGILWRRKYSRKKSSSLMNGTGVGSVGHNAASKYLNRSRLSLNGMMNEETKLFPTQGSSSDGSAHMQMPPTALFNPYLPPMDPSLLAAAAAAVGYLPQATPATMARSLMFSAGSQPPPPPNCFIPINDNNIYTSCPNNGGGGSSDSESLAGFKQASMNIPPPPRMPLPPTPTGSQHGTTMITPNTPLIGGPGTMMRRQSTTMLMDTAKQNNNNWLDTDMFNPVVNPYMNTDYMTAAAILQQQQQLLFYNMNNHQAIPPHNNNNNYLFTHNNAKHKR